VNLEKSFLQAKTKYSTHSQLGQDALAISLFGGEGYFVEFGAADGFHLSNTLMLEEVGGWQGVIAEPNPSHRESVKKRSCHVDTRCVYKTTGEKIEFYSVNNLPELSTISKYADSDHWSAARQDSAVFSVETITLDDLLEHYSAPQMIEYISVDTEGSEFDILSSFSFKRDVKLFTIEHNYTKNRGEIHSLMTSHGYTRILERFSQWDDWYLKD
jgi:FkbM family methyltransferase